MPITEMPHVIASFSGWLNGMCIGHALKRPSEIWAAYLRVYLGRKPTKARNWRAEANIKKEFGNLMAVKKAGDTPISYRFDDYFWNRQHIGAIHRRICFERKPKKRLNTYQVLRFIEESK